MEGQHPGILMKIFSRQSFRRLVNIVFGMPAEYQIGQTELLRYVLYIMTEDPNAVAAYHLDCSVRVDCDCYFCSY